MTTAFALANGVSRQGLDLPWIHHYGPIFGCNALYKDFEPDVLVATDAPISGRIQDSGYSQRRIFYTRRCLPNSGARQIPKKYYGNSSGPVAAALAAIDGHKHVYLIGYDLGPGHDGKFNNVYAGTEFYKAQGTPPTFTGNWIKQISTVIQDFPQIRWTRVCGATTMRHAELDKLSNLEHVEMALFLARINTQKEA
jgi:hypothetical protein